MGTLLTYRIAGGEAGMRHFMAQFGPALQWPWTKLTDVPELTDELLDRIVAQSDAQAAGASVRELERLRDDCLVAVLQGLRSVPVRSGRRPRGLRGAAAIIGLTEGVRESVLAQRGSSRQSPSRCSWAGRCRRSRRRPASR